MLRVLYPCRLLAALGFPCWELTSYGFSTALFPSIHSRGVDEIAQATSLVLECKNCGPTGMRGVERLCMYAIKMHRGIVDPTSQVNAAPRVERSARPTTFDTVLPLELCILGHLDLCSTGTKTLCCIMQKLLKRALCWLIRHYH